MFFLLIYAQRSSGVISIVGDASGQEGLNEICVFTLCSETCSKFNESYAHAQFTRINGRGTLEYARNYGLLFHGSRSYFIIHTGDAGTSRDTEKHFYRSVQLAHNGGNTSSPATLQHDVSADSAGQMSRPEIPVSQCASTPEGPANDGKQPIKISVD